MELNRYIDHTLLSPKASGLEITKLCLEALEYKFCAVCVSGTFVAQAAELLVGSSTKLASVVGFPLGTSSTAVKAFEAKSYVLNGATEIDMVINLGWFLDGDYNKVIADIAAVKQAIGDTTLKVIIETGYLNKVQIQKAARCVAQAGAHFVKTATGFGPRGVSLEDIQILHKEVGSGIGIKASGGIKTKVQALELIAAGATRIGTSNGVELLQ